MIGGHYDIIVLDDIIDQKNSRTEHRRREIVRWFNSTLMPMLEPEGKLIVIGTKWHQADLYAHLQKLPNFHSFTYKAIMEKDGKEFVLWPERFSKEKLEEIRNSFGETAFMMQYQNEFISDEDSPIKYDWVQESQENYRPPEAPYEVYMGVDLASRGMDTDYFTITIVAIKDGIFYVLDGFRDKVTMNQQFEIINNYFEKWYPNRIGIESSAQQKMITDTLMENKPHLPIIPIKSSIISDRMSRVQRLSVLFETKRILLNPMLVNWIDELTSYPRSAHDDTIDSLSFAIQASQFTTERKSNINWEEIPKLISFKSSGRSSEDMFHVTKV